MRAELGRFVSHPRAIAVTVEDGQVRLRGPILAQEVDHLRAAIAKVGGVAGVEDALEVHESAGEVPGLQGPGRRASAIRVTPATRVLLGALAATGFVAAAGRNAPLRRAAAIMALGAAIANVEAARLRSERPARESA